MIPTSSLSDNRYSYSLYKRERLQTIEVKIGDLAIGGQNPIRVQSMTTTDTMDTLATVEQSIRMWESGSEYVRITAPSKKEALNLENIKKELRARGCPVPLIADIHYTPNAAEIAARIVEKVRVNPGNYVDKKKFNIIEYSDDQYQAELDRIHKRFAPLVKICKEYGCAMRIGTNHGSLSDRILSRYGDTPLGMVESALEFLRICELYNYDQVVLSMKASNPQVMVQAYRLLVQKMLERDKVYPLHLGVTEAGEGEDGRIKSAQGIATLLMDGIGDTVRVSLTEEPEYESPVAKFLIDMYEGPGYSDPQINTRSLPANYLDPFAFKRRESNEVLNTGNGQVPRVVADLEGKLSRESLAEVGYSYQPALDKYNFHDMSADFLWCGDALPAFELPGGLKAVLAAEAWKHLRNREVHFPYFAQAKEFFEAEQTHSVLNFVRLGMEQWEDLRQAGENVCWVLEAEGREAGHAWRFMINKLDEQGLKQPIFLKYSLPKQFDFYSDDQLEAHLRLSEDAKRQLFLAGISGSQVVDGRIDGLWLAGEPRLCNRSSFGILQASRLRITKTEYISCPSCGRTLFDLQETTARIRKRTEHLKGVKIGIMGCIVNGPGEMADADYGYVGVGPGKIALYRGQTVVEKAVQTSEAVDKLIDLIRGDGMWIDPSD